MFARISQKSDVSLLTINNKYFYYTEQHSYGTLKAKFSKRIKYMSKTSMIWNLIGHIVPNYNASINLNAENYTVLPRETKSFKVCQRYSSANRVSIIHGYLNSERLFSRMELGSTYYRSREMFVECSQFRLIKIYCNQIQ